MSAALETATEAPGQLDLFAVAATRPLSDRQQRCLRIAREAFAEAERPAQSRARDIEAILAWARSQRGMFAACILEAGENLTPAQADAARRAIARCERDRHRADPRGAR